MVIATIHFVALEFYLYWVFPWLDILMHLLGGVWVSLISLWIFFESGYIKLPRTLPNTVYVAVVSIIFVAISWEIFELAASVPIEANFALDTTVDLIMDAIGAFIGWFYFKHVFLKNE